MANQLKIDPTRTTMLRRKFVADMTRRFTKLRRAIQELVVDDDAFGLATGDSFLTLTNQQVAKQAWRFRTNSQKVKEYRNWLKQRVKLGILKPVGGIAGQPWTATYIESAYKKGAIRAYTDLRVDELAAHPSLFEGGQAEFIRTAFGSPEVLQKIELLYERAFNELDGITKVMEQQMSRVLAEGLSQGWGVNKIAKSLTDNVSKMNRTRANVLARTEIIRAHAEGQLDSYERLGVKELQLMAEWSTAGDERVCIECGELEGVVITVEEARGLIPRHPNCRCMWIPAKRGRKEKGQKWGKDKDRAIGRSIQREAPKTIKRSAEDVWKRSVWRGKELIKKPVLPMIKGKITPKPVVKGKVTPKPIIRPKQKLPKGINLKNMNNKYIDEVSEEISDLVEKYPEVGKNFKMRVASSSQDFGQKYIDLDAIAYIQQETNTVILNPNYFGKTSKYDLTKYMEKLNKEGWLAGNSPKDIVTHEFAHQIENITFNYNTRIKMENYFDDVWGISKGVSKYGVSNKTEMFVESFVRFCRGTATKVSKGVMKILGI